MDAIDHTKRRLLFALTSAGCSSVLGCGMEKKSSFSPPLSDAVSARVFRCVNGSPSENMRKVLELSGGIEKLIGSDDIVVIKPNLQWWSHGAPNIAACAVLIESIFGNTGFAGEVVLAENTHRGSSPWNATAWSTAFDRNSDKPGINNYNSLSASLKKMFGDRFSVCHWIDINANGRRVYHPKDGPGYVYCDGTGGVPLISMDNGLSGDNHREVIMTYPIFTTDRGTRIDFKNGIWGNGAFTNQPIKFINLAALNHHSTYCGMTSSVKNYFGIVDLSNGADPHNAGKLTKAFHNFHSFAFDEWAQGPVPGMLGAEIGTFMNTIRKADFNITTAEWVGLASRTEAPAANTHAVLASDDPVALDYHASKYILYPNSHCRHHDPEWREGPLFQYLFTCANTSRCAINEACVNIVSHDFNKNSADHMEIKGAIDWGNDPKMLAKYALFRWGSRFLH